MDNGASSYRRFLDGDEGGIVEIIRDYKDGLILYLNGFVQNMKMIPVSYEDLQRIESEEEGLEISYLKEEQKIMLHRAMGKLNSDYQQVLYLSFFEDFDNGQIAAVMKKSKRQVENLIYRAKMSLRSELDKEGFCHEGL